MIENKQQQYKENTCPECGWDSIELEATFKPLYYVCTNCGDEFGLDELKSIQKESLGKN